MTTHREQLRTWRKAYRDTLKDPEFLADAKKSKLNIVYVSGEKIDKYVDAMLAMSPETKKRLKWMVPK